MANAMGLLVEVEGRVHVVYHTLLTLQQSL